MRLYIYIKENWPQLGRILRPSEPLEISVPFLVVFGCIVPLTSDGMSSMQLNMLQWTGQSPQQRIMSLKCSSGGGWETLL